MMSPFRRIMSCSVDDLEIACSSYLRIYNWQLLPALIKTQILGIGKSSWSLSLS